MKRTALALFVILACFSISLAAWSRSEEQPQAESQALPNFLKVSERIYCGGQPDGEIAFKRLATLGIKTVVSVDGAKPNVEAARAHGLRYVHIPSGYDGISQHAAHSLVKLTRAAEGPFYIHCHRGRHRGPAAAAVAGLAAGEIDHAAAQAIKVRAGAGRDYPGLWRDVQRFRVPPRDAKLPRLVEVAETEPFTKAMAGIDRAYEKLAGFRRADWKASADQTELLPWQQALLLKEGFREARRLRSDEFELPFGEWLAAAEMTAHQLEMALLKNDRIATDAAFRTLLQSCFRCHGQYRD